MDRNVIKIWASIIVKALGDKGKLSIDEIHQTTGLHVPHICAAIGWLAWENKIVFTDNNHISLSHYNERYY